MRPFVLLLLISTVVVFVDADPAFTKCKKKECTEKGYCSKSSPDLGNCVQGICKCYNPDEKPKGNCTTAATGDCQSACKKMETTVAKLAEPYLCDKLCVCKFRVQNINRCGTNNDCGGGCKSKSEETACNSQTKACLCAGENNSLGTLSPTCKDEQYCQAVCKSGSLPAKTGKLCGNYCYCPVQKIDSSISSPGK